MILELIFKAYLGHHGSGLKQEKVASNDTRLRSQISFGRSWRLDGSVSTGGPFLEMLCVFMADSTEFWTHSLTH